MKYVLWMYHLTKSDDDVSRESDDDDDDDDDEHHDILFCSFNSRDAGFVLPDLPCKN